MMVLSETRLEMQSCVSSVQQLLISVLTLYSSLTSLDLDSLSTQPRWNPADRTGHIVLINKLAHMKKVSKNCCDISANV